MVGNNTSGITYYNNKNTPDFSGVFNLLKNKSEGFTLLKPATNTNIIRYFPHPLYLVSLNHGWFNERCWFFMNRTSKLSEHWVAAQILTFIILGMNGSKHRIFNDMEASISLKRIKRTY